MSSLFIMHTEAWKHSLGLCHSVLQLVNPVRVTQGSCEIRTFWPSGLLSSSGLEMRITLLILPEDPASAVTSCSVASAGIPVGYTRHSENGGSCVVAGTTFFFFLASGGLAGWKTGRRWGQFRSTHLNPLKQDRNSF